MFKYITMHTYWQTIDQYIEYIDQRICCKTIYINFGQVQYITQSSYDNSLSLNIVHLFTLKNTFSCSPIYTLLSLRRSESVCPTPTVFSKSIFEKKVCSTSSVTMYYGSSSLIFPKQQQNIQKICNFFPRDISKIISLVII